jgi:hypothetical protein
MGNFFIATSDDRRNFTRPGPIADYCVSDTPKSPVGEPEMSV